MRGPLVSLAVLMTCHNRKVKTIACLESLLNRQRSVGGVRLEVYLVDDGSTDGTGDAVRQLFPTVRVLIGDGTLYWNGGMRMAMDAAIQEGFDFYLWLNDDVVLYEDALPRLLAAYAQVRDNGAKEPIIVGSVCDPVSHQITYGGSKIISRLNPLTFELIAPTGVPQRCDAFHGNVVLIPGSVVHELGNLSPRFRHRGGDYEYSLRARRAKFPAWVAPSYFGTCARNLDKGTWKDPEVPVRARWKNLIGPKGSPIAERFYLQSRYGGPLWPLHFVSVYVRFILSLVTGLRGEGRGGK